MTVMWQIRIMPRPGRPWTLLAQGSDLARVMAFLTAVRVAMASGPAKFTVVRTETLEASP